jgi:hypothetical protein
VHGYGQIDGFMGGQGQHPANAGDWKIPIGVFRDRTAEITGEAFNFGLGDIAADRVG